MATRIKTIEYSLQVLKSLANNTLTVLQQKDLYIPEFSGTVTFKNVMISACVHEVAGHVIGNYTTRQLDINLNGAGAITYIDSNTHTLSGENTCLFFGFDLTELFKANWTSGTSATIDVSVLVNNASATPFLGDVNIIIYITYEYDDTQPTQIKTVYIPIQCPCGALDTSKRGSIDTIPALDTELPEASKSYRDMYQVIQGNYNNTNNTTDQYIVTQLDSVAVMPEMSSNCFEAGQASDYFFRNIFKWSSSSFDTSTTHNYFIYSQAARMNHLQSWLTVTYEFDSTSNNNTYISLILPMEVSSPMGGPTIGDYQSASREFWIQEPDPITTKEVAFYPFWDQVSNIANLYMRISGNYLDNNRGTHSWITYTDLAAVLCGSNAAMVMSGCNMTLHRGRNELEYNVYRTDVSDLGWGLSGYWIINYTAGKPTQGYGAANRTIRWNITGSLINPARSRISTQSFSLDFTESDYFMNAIGNQYSCLTESTATLYSINLLFEKSGSEGGVQWVPSYIDAIHTDPETGLRTYNSQIRKEFKRWPKDADPDRLDIKSPRRWYIQNGNNVTGYHQLGILFTIHNISYSVAGSVSGYSGDGSGITVNLWKPLDIEMKTSGTTSAGGSYNITWWDNTEPIFTEARQSSTLVGISPTGLAT